MLPRHEHGGGPRRSLARSPRNASALSGRSFCAPSLFLVGRRCTAHRRCEHKHGRLIWPTSAPSATCTPQRGRTRGRGWAAMTSRVRSGSPALSAGHAPAACKNPGTRVLVRIRISAEADAARQPTGNAGTAVALCGTETDVYTRTRTRLPFIMSVCVHMCDASRRCAPSALNPPTSRRRARVPLVSCSCPTLACTPVNEAPSQHPLQLYEVKRAVADAIQE